MSDPHTPPPTSAAGARLGPDANPPEREAAQAAQAAQATQGANEAQQPDALAAALAEATMLKTKMTELGDQYLRARAEAENARRRADEEITKARKFAVESFADSLLPVCDSLEAGLAIQGATPEQIREGAEATLRQLRSALERNKVLEINPAAGTRFDPHHHQAISMVPSAQEPNTVVGVLQKGYLIAERVLRPALVSVAAPK